MSQIDVQKIILEIKTKYPGKKIIFDPPNSSTPNEIICEIEPTTQNPNRSIALAVVGKSTPHYHKNSTEIYECVKGELIVWIDNKKHVLKKGERIEIKPNMIHSAEGANTWFHTYSEPGWTFEDHHAV